MFVKAHRIEWWWRCFAAPEVLRTSHGVVAVPEGRFEAAVHLRKEVMSNTCKRLLFIYSNIHWNRMLLAEVAPYVPYLLTH